VVNPSVFPIGYFGTDISCTTDLSTIDVLISNNDMVTQRLIRRLSTPNGAMNLIDPDPASTISTDLSQYVNAKIDTNTSLTIQNDVNNVCLQDQAVLNVTTQTIAPTIANRTLIINTSGNTSQGPFSLTISIDQLNATILYEALNNG
jgi:hypothetical protein